MTDKFYNIDREDIVITVDVRGSDGDVAPYSFHFANDDEANQFTKDACSRIGKPGPDGAVIESVNDATRRWPIYRNAKYALADLDTLTRDL